MKQSERFAKVRNDLKLSRDDFGAKIGVSRDVIANIELERAEPKQIFISHFCSVFGVNEKWLLTGEGEPYIDDAVNFLDRFFAEYNIVGDERRIFELYVQLPLEMRASVVEAIRRIGQGLDPVVLATAARTKSDSADAVGQTRTESGDDGGRIIKPLSKDMDDGSEP